MATIDERTQELIALRAGSLLIANARLQAENESLAAANAKAEEIRDASRSEARPGQESV